MKRFFFAIFAGLAVISSAVLFGSSPAKAVSPFDDLIVVTDHLEMKSLDGYDDLSTTWLSVAKNSLQVRCDDGFWCDYLTALDDILDGSWLVTYSPVDQYNNPAYYTVYYSDDPNIICNFHLINNSPDLICNGSAQIRELRVDFCGLSVPHADSETGYCIGYTPTLKSSVYVRKQVFISTFNVIYPLDYDGEIIPDTFTPLPPEPDLTQHWRWSGMTFEVKDTTDYDVVPDECWFQLPNNIQGDNFTEVGYNCNNPPWIGWTVYDGYSAYPVIHFVRYGETIYSKNFTVNIDGSSGDSETGSLNLFEDCLVLEPPFLNIDGCLANFSLVGDLLSFGVIRFGNNFQVTESCRNLQVLGDWIHRPNHTICPQFSSNVRQIVTPFVTLLLGALMLGWLLRKGGSGGWNG